MLISNKIAYCIDPKSVTIMNNLIQKYELILKTFRGMEISEDFYFKPIKPKLFDLELITLGIVVESSGIEFEYQLFRD